MKKPIVFLSLFVFSLFILSCDAGLKGKDSDDNRFEKYHELERELKTVEGTYVGKLTLHNKKAGRIKVPIELKLHVMTEIEGDSTENGEIPEPKLVGYFRRLDILQSTDRVPFKAAFDLKTGKLFMAYKSGEGKDSIKVDLEGFIVGNKIIAGDYSIVSGSVGTFTAKRVTNKVIAPGSGDSEEERRRSEAYFSKILGLYKGKITPGHGLPFPMDFDFYLYDRPRVDKAGHVISYDVVLKVGVTRPDFGISIGALDAAYNLENGAVTVEGKLNKKDQPGSAFFSASGKLKNGLLKFERVSDHRGVMGSFEGSKTDPQ